MGASDAFEHFDAIFGDNGMKPTPLLDFWQKPAAAGAPVAMIATTFAFEPDFFEKNCLARFLEVSSVNEESGSIDDIVASVELHELLRNARVTVLSDRSAPIQRTSLLWDILSCQVEGGLLHAKVTVLIWENATRVILGSANLTSAGYRRQIELGLAADLGPGCLLPPAVLTEIADELASYLRLVPGHEHRPAVIKRAEMTLDLFRARLRQQADERLGIKVSFAPTNARARPLDQLERAWSGPQPLTATHLSPFWDSTDQTVLQTVRQLLTGRPAESRSHRVAIVLSPRGQSSFSGHLGQIVDSVQALKALDDETRTLHAKCLLIESEQWVAALIGSSNHTRAGFGIGERRHREMNLWLGASRESKEGKALLALIQLGHEVPADTEEIAPTDEDEVQLPALPSCFGLCWVTRAEQSSPWELNLSIDCTKDMPEEWSIVLPGQPTPLTRKAWAEGGALQVTIVPIGHTTLPMYIMVRWDGCEAPWAVVADNRQALPPGPELSKLRAQHLLAALASGRSLSSILREEMEKSAATKNGSTLVVLDPLKRFEQEGSLLRKGRGLAASLSAMQRRLEQQVISIETLRGRLSGPLGPEFVATKVVEAYEGGEQSRAESLFTIAEIALVVGRVNWINVLKDVDREEGRISVKEILSNLDRLRRRIGNEIDDMAVYAEEAIQEAGKCFAH